MFEIYKSLQEKWKHTWIKQNKTEAWYLPNVSPD